MEGGEASETFHHNHGIMAGIMLQVNSPMAPNCLPPPAPLGALDRIDADASTSSPSAMLTYSNPFLLTTGDAERGCQAICL